MKYIVLHRIKAHRSNALATPFLASPIVLFAAAMLGHALGDDTKTPISSVMYVHHDAYLLSEKLTIKNGENYITTVFPHQYRAAHFIDKNDYSSHKNKASKTVEVEKIKGAPKDPRTYSKSLSLQPVFNADIEVSLVFGFESEFNPSIERIKESLDGRRLAGGTIHAIDSVEIFDAFGEVLQAIGTGFVLMDRSDVLQHDNSMDSFIQNLLNPQHVDGKRPWRAATVCGYSMITDFTQKKNVRNNSMHAYAEPLVGLFDLLSVRQILNTYTNQTPSSAQYTKNTLFFSWTWSGSNFLLRPLSLNKEYGYDI